MAGDTTLADPVREREEEVPPRRVPGVPRALVSLSELSWRVLVCAAAIALLAYLLWQVRFVMLPIFLALLVATLLAPPARALERRGLAPLAATTVVFVAGLALLAAAVTLIVPPVVDELDELGRQVRAGADRVGDYLVSGPFDLSRGQIQDAIDNAAERLGDSGGAVASGVLSGALLIGQLVGGLLLTAVLVFFFVKDGASLWRWVVRLFPAARRDTVRLVGTSSWQILGAYVRGVAIVATVDAVLIGIALTIIGVPLVLPLAVLTFLAAFFPLIGAVLAGLAAALVALVTQGLVAALIVVAAVTVIQQLEGDLLYPLVVGRTVQLHPVAILLAVATGAVVAGLIGAIVAVPLVAVLSAAIPILRTARAPRVERVSAVLRDDR
ncbi:MAG: AI-2E family transporter [Solirubrobacterales bacterium]|nr:AI-2E family transporter [Solirubrobacterales bacterium]